MQVILKIDCDLGKAGTIVTLSPAEADQAVHGGLARRLMAPDVHAEPPAPPARAKAKSDE